MQDTTNTPDGIPNDYAFQIKGLRSRLGLTQAGLAKRIGVSTLTVNRWENEQTQPLPVAWERLLMLEESDSAPRPALASVANKTHRPNARDAEDRPDAQAEMREFHQRFASSAWSILRSFERRLDEVSEVAARLKRELLSARMNADADVSNEPARSVAIYIELDVLMPGVSRWHLYVMGWLRRFLGERGLASRVYIGRREYRTIAETGLPPELLEPTCTEFVEAVDRNQVAAVLAISTPPHARWVAPLRRRGVPIIGSSTELQHRVGLDLTGGLNASLDYFQALGKRRVAMVYWGGYPGAHFHGEFAARLAKQLRKRGLPVRPQWMRGDLHPTTTGAGWEEFREVWTTGHEKPDALIVADDCLLPDVDTAIGEMNIQVPDQLAVVGFTNRHIVTPTHLPMAKVEFDPQAYAEAMGQILLDALATGQAEPREQIIPLQWIAPPEHDNDKISLRESSDPATTRPAPNKK